MVVHSNVYLLVVPVMKIHSHRCIYIVSGSRLVVQALHKGLYVDSVIH